ncbi:MAG: hypothetical protein GY846_26295 [Deltaproteobacteria bacterium]|nr:hypothetical protein [Deltaproteobacteria bacterium]
MQGRLRKESLSVVVKTECAHCSQPLTLEIDSELNCKVGEGGVDPLVFVPNVNIKALEDPSIIEAF